MTSAGDGLRTGILIENLLLSSGEPSTVASGYDGSVSALRGNGRAVEHVEKRA
jgi:hypothetical protein